MHRAGMARVFGGRCRIGLEKNTDSLTVAVRNGVRRRYRAATVRESVLFS